MSGTQAPQIQVTTDYAQFKLMKGNRPIDYNHVKRLKREMQENPQLFASNPIQVNEFNYIIDGQHRRLAAQEIGVPVYYIVAKGLRLDDTRILNVTQRRWTLLEFAQSYADSGREDYKIFLQFVKEFPQLSPSILRLFLIGGRLHNIDGMFRRGEFEIGDIDVARVEVQRLVDIIRKTGIRMNTTMAMAFMKLFNSAELFDYDLFMSKLESETAVNLLHPSNAMRSCLRSIEEIYNFGSRVQKRLY